MAYRRPRRGTVAVVTFAFSMTVIPLGPVNAGMIPTDRVIQQERISADRERVAAFIGREDVREELQKYGVKPAEAAARVAALSDAEIRQLAAKFDVLPAGQDAGATIIGAAVTIFIILLITDLLCLTSVFNFTRCVTR